jgi:hypothetical protein
MGVAIPSALAPIADAKAERCRASVNDVMGHERRMEVREPGSAVPSAPDQGKGGWRNPAPGPNLTLAVQQNAVSLARWGSMRLPAAYNCPSESFLLVAPAFLSALPIKYPADCWSPIFRSCSVRLGHSCARPSRSEKSRTQRRSPFLAPPDLWSGESLMNGSSDHDAG